MGKVIGHITMYAERDGRIVMQTAITTGVGDTVNEAMDDALASARGMVERAIALTPAPDASDAQAS